MLKREDLTSENVDQIVADAHKAGYHFFPSAAERAASFKTAMARHQPGEELWVFAYGSLMWNPAIEFVEQQPCRVDGWRRSFCFWMPMGRGTPELPGLMLALEQGGACEGIAYRLSPHQVESELGLVWNREMLAGIYQPAWVPTTLRDGRTVTAITFVVDAAHCQYCGDLPIERAAHHIAFAEGRRGASPRLFSPIPRLTHAPCTSTIPISRNWSSGSPACATAPTSFRQCRPTARPWARRSAAEQKHRQACDGSYVVT